MVNIKSLSWARLITALTADRAIAACGAVVLGTAIAFVVSFLFPLIAPDENLLKAYARQYLPIYTVAMGRVIGIALLVIFVFSVGKLWRSLRLGLVPFSTSIWVACAA